MKDLGALADFTLPLSPSLSVRHPFLDLDDADIHTAGASPKRADR
jgi:hypothetical protein